MQIMRQIQLHKRLGLGFGLLIVLLIAVSVLALQRIRQAQDRLEGIVTKTNVQSTLVYKMLIAVNQVALGTRELALLHDDAERKTVLDGLQKSRDSLDAAEQQLAAMLAAHSGALPEGNALMQKIAQSKSEVHESNSRVIGLAMAGQQEIAVQVLMHEARPRQLALLRMLGDLADMETRLNEASALGAQMAYDNSRLVMVVLCGVGTVLAIVLALQITRSVGDPMTQAVDFAHQIAAGNLTATIHVQGKDEAALLLLAMQEMQRNLSYVVAEVRAGSESVAQASLEIAHGNADLSTRTEQQASRLEEITSSMEQVGAAVQQNAASAANGNQVAKNAAAIAEDGCEVVQRVVHTMRGINDSSRKIADIVGVIDSIAFQTNILALNAAVEAARAGEQGRGFAVVATEVRSLAGRSATAAREIKELIEASVERVEQGSQLVDHAGATMVRVVDSIRKVSDIMEEISTASAQQAVGIGQVGEAIMDMERVTQQSAALVEQIAAASNSLNGQATELVKTVGVFSTSSHSSETYRQDRLLGLNAGLAIA